jgi:hypothetical protein
MCQAYMCKIWLLHLSQIVSPFSLRFGAERVHVSEWSTKLVINPKETEGSSTIGRLGKGSKEGRSIISMWHSLGAHCCPFPSSHSVGALFSFAQQAHVGLLGLAIRCPIATATATARKIPLSTFQTRAGNAYAARRAYANQHRQRNKQTNQGLLLLLLPLISSLPWFEIWFSLPTTKDRAKHFRQTTTGLLVRRRHLVGSFVRSSRNGCMPVDCCVGNRQGMFTASTRKIPFIHFST